MQDTYLGVLGGHEGQTTKKTVHYTLHTPYFAEI